MALERGGLSEDPGLVVQLVEAALLQHQLRQQQRQPQRVGTKGGPGDGLAAGGRPVSPLEALALEVASDDRLLESLAEDEAGAGAGAGAGMEAEAGLRRRLLGLLWNHAVAALASKAYQPALAFFSAAVPLLPATAAVVPGRDTTSPGGPTLLECRRAQALCKMGSGQHEGCARTRTALLRAVVPPLDCV